jgi:hypothetical protein
MKRILFIIIVTILLLFSFLLNCDRNIPEAKLTPGITFNEEVHNFGEIEQYSECEHIFKFKNTGKGKLIIEDIRPTCGCIATLLNDKNILPGKKGEIKVILNTGEKKGNISYPIYITTNIPDKKRVKLEIKADIIPLFIIRPEQFPLQDIRLGKIEEFTIIVESGTVKDFKISDVITKRKFISFDFKEINSKDRIYEIKVKVNTKEIKPDIYSGDISIIILYHKKKKIINIPYSFRIIGNIIAYPSSVYINNWNREIFSRSIDLIASEKFNILKVENPGKNFNYKLVELIPQKNYSLIIFSDDFENIAEVHDKIIIKTDDTYQQIIEIPVHINFTN